MDNLDQKIGMRLRKARKLRGYKSARAFAIKHSIPESTYSQHETGKRSLSPTIVLSYCGHLDIEPGWLLAGDDTEISGLNHQDTVAEVALNASKRQVGYQPSNNAPMMITDSLRTMDKDILKGVLRKAMQSVIGLQIDSSQIDALVNYCAHTYSSITQLSSDSQVKDTIR
jgi:hypothetical protein